VLASAQRKKDHCGERQRAWNAQPMPPPNESRSIERRVNPLARPRPSGTLSPKGARAAIPVINPRPLGGEGGEGSEPGEGVLHMSPYLRGSLVGMERALTSPAKRSGCPPGSQRQSVCFPAERA